jgi:flagellar motor switch protein FliG
MSSFLSRFKKAGGFMQLLQLFESNPPDQQGQLIQWIAEEDPGWASLVQSKQITLKRIFTWPISILGKILSELSQPQIIGIYLSLDEESRERLLISLSPKMNQQVKSELEKSPIQTVEEKNLACVRIVQLVRQLENRRVIRFEEFDPTLVIDKRVIAS